MSELPIMEGFDLPRGLWACMSPEAFERFIAADGLLNREQRRRLWGFLGYPMPIPAVMRVAFDPARVARLWPTDETVISADGYARRLHAALLVR